MIFLYILGGLCALIVGILFLPIHLTAVYDGTPKLYLRVLFVRIDLTKKILSGQKKESPTPEGEKEPEISLPKQTFGEKVRDVLDYIAVIKRTVTETFAVIRRHVRIKVSRFYLCVSASDAATTAMLWGTLKPAADALFDILENNMHLTVKDMAVYPSFTGEGFSFSAKIKISVRVLRAVQILLTAVTAFTQDGEETT